MKDEPKTPLAGHESHVPANLIPPKPVKPQRGFDPAALKGAGGGRQPGPMGKRMTIPGKGRGR